MKSLLGLAGGGSLATLWGKIPAIIKVPVIFGAGILAASELNIDANHSWFSNKIFGGQAAQGNAQIVDPVDTRKDMNAGHQVSGADRMIAVQYEAGDADARTKEATADAALESESELLAKQAGGIELTSTEALRLRELQLKQRELRVREAEARSKEASADADTEGQQELAAKDATGTSTEALRLKELQLKAQELRLREAEARIKEAEATAAKSTAAVQNKVNEMILNGDLLGGGNVNDLLTRPSRR